MTFFAPLVVYSENKWFIPPCKCCLKNSATLVFTTFEIPKHPAFPECLVWNVLEPPYLILQSLTFTILIRYLSKNSHCFTHWLVHPYVNKGPLQWLSRILQLWGHVNVEIKTLDLLKQFSLRNDSAAFY